MITRKVEETVSCDFCKGEIKKIEQTHRVVMGYSLGDATTISVTLIGQFPSYSKSVHICNKCQVKALEEVLAKLKK